MQKQLYGEEESRRERIKDLRRGERREWDGEEHCDNGPRDIRRWCHLKTDGNKEKQRKSETRVKFYSTHQFGFADGETADNCF